MESLHKPLNTSTENARHNTEITDLQNQGALHWFSHDYLPAVPWLGGKGSGLARGLHLGLPVPAFLALHPAWAGSDTELQNLLNESFPEAELFAVRSSAGKEDGAENSFAGILETELNVERSGIFAALARVRSSAESLRAKAYMQQHAPSDAAANTLTVLIMPMLPVQWSGIFFGMDPMGLKHDLQLLSVHQGLGDALVSGEVNGQYIYLSRSQPGQIQPESDTVNFISEANLREIQAWHETMYLNTGLFQDMELAFACGKLYLLQARPVTTGHSVNNKTLAPVYWDNSNIVESYPGLSLPATYTFIKPLYTAVYISLSQVLGIPEGVIKRYAAVYEQMLGLHKGRIYYNLNSWFGLLSLLPGYNLNAAFMEQMMGVSERAPIPPLPGNTGWRARYDVARMAFCMVKAHFQLPGMSAKFEANFNGILKGFYAKKLSRLSLTELWNELQAFQFTMVSQWQAPLVNDLMTMIWFGILGKSCKKQEPADEGNALLNALMVNSGQVVTVGPARDMEKLVLLIRQEPVLHEVCKAGKPLQLWHLLQTNSKYKAVLTEVQAYLQTWGLRCKAELKLETIPYALNPEGFMALLSEQVRSLSIKAPDTQNAGKAEERYFKNAGPIARWWKNYVLNLARTTIARREALRYKRTEGFHAVRLLLLQIGRMLQSKSILTHYRDVFYLALPELEDAVLGSSFTGNWQQVVAMRKQQYEDWQSTNLPDRLISYDSSLFGIEPVPPKVVVPGDAAGNADSAKAGNNLSADGRPAKSMMQGKGCSPGVVRGKVTMLHSPEGVNSLHGNILVAESTDPGWVVLFPTAGAILVERGSLLSHAAIVCREMGIPCIVGLPGIMQALSNNDEVEMDGSTGKLFIL
ncbi:MAG: PEP/pyruvate-binding domain-containing protein [Bacteroidota bacterium]